MPGLCGDDRVECSAGGVPVFELRHLNLEPELPRQLGHPRVGFDPEHLATGGLELPGSDACTDADVDTLALTLIGTGHLLFGGREGVPLEAGAVRKVVTTVIAGVVQEPLL